jgi:hypothetical protein
LKFLEEKTKTLKWFLTRYVYSQKQRDYDHFHIEHIVNTYGTPDALKILHKWTGTEYFLAYKDFDKCIKKTKDYINSPNYRYKDYSPNITEDLCGCKCNIM